MYFFALLSMSMILTLTPYVQCTNNGTSDSSIRKASNWYLSTPYAFIANPISDICEALALTNQTGIQRKLLRFFAVANKIIHTAAYGASAFNKPNSDNFKGSYLKQPLQALIAWQTAKEIPQSTALLTHDLAITQKLRRFSPNAIKEISRARIKNSIIRILTTIALGYLLKNVTTNPDSWIIYNHFLSSQLYRYLIDHTAACPQLEETLLQEVAQDKK